MWAYRPPTEPQCALDLYPYTGRGAFEQMVIVHCFALGGKLSMTAGMDGFHTMKTLDFPGYYFLPPGWATFSTRSAAPCFFICTVVIPGGRSTARLRGSRGDLHPAGYSTGNTARAESLLQDDHHSSNDISVPGHRPRRSDQTSCVQALRIPPPIQTTASALSMNKRAVASNKAHFVLFVCGCEIQNQCGVSFCYYLLVSFVSVMGVIPCCFAFQSV
jgi:hypothetical protein